MNMKYTSDRNFTDIIHNQVAIPEIYHPLNWRVKTVDKDELEYVDLNEGIDYFLEDFNGHLITVQERFREKRYQNFNDCTLRFRRDHHVDASRHESEFYKIKADYLVYGIINQNKYDVTSGRIKGSLSFIKYVVVDLKVLQHKIEEGKIKLNTQIKRSFINYRDRTMEAAVLRNHDYSSSFVAFDIKQLYELFNKDGIILRQSGFI